MKPGPEPPITRTSTPHLLWPLLAGAALFALFAWGSAVIVVGLGRQTVIAGAVEPIGAMQDRDVALLAELFARAEAHARFLSETPPIAGIGRALRNNGIDPVDGTPLAGWRTRLEQIAAPWVKSTPLVFPARPGGGAEGGRELVRAPEDAAGKLTVVAQADLQQKGDRPYFTEALRLPAGTVYLSPIVLNQEQVRIEQPPRVTLRAALAVRNERDEVFGVVVVNSSIQPLLDEIGGGSGLQDVQEWVTDAAGQYLWHPQPGKAFAHELAPPGTTWQQEFTAAPADETIAPVAGMTEGTTQATLRAPDGADWLIFTRTLRPPDAAGAGGVVLHSGIPRVVIEARAWERARVPLLLTWAMGLATIGLVAFMLLRWRGTPLGLSLEAEVGEPGRTLRIFGLELPLTPTGRLPLWQVAVVVLLPVLWWWGLTLLLGQPLTQPFVVMLLPVLMASCWGGLYGGLAASLLAVVGAWDLGTDSPLLNWTGHADPLNAFSAATLLLAGLLVTFAQDTVRRRAAQVVVAERTKVEERRAAEAALRQFKSTLDATRDCVFMFHPDTLQFFYVNQGARDQVGYTEAELLGMHPYDIKPQYPEPQFREMIAPLLDGRQPSVRFETLHRHKDGHDVPVEVFLQYITPAGEPARFLNIVTDITARKAAEAATVLAAQRTQLETALDMFQLGTMFPTSDRTAFMLNDRMFEILEIPKDSRSYPYDLGAVYAGTGRTPVNQAAYEAGFATAMNDGTADWETTFTTQTGELRHLMVRMRRLEADTVMTVVADVTADRQVRQALTVALQAAQAADRAKGDFLSVISHEIRTPLNGVMGALQLLDLRDTLDEKCRDLLRQAYRSSQLLLTILNDVLDYSSLQRGRLSVTLERMPTRSLVNDLTQLANDLPVHPNVHVAVRQEADRDVLVQVDTLRVQQILLNLLNNAAKFTTEGRIMVSIVLSRVGAQTTMLDLVVADTGIGISPETQASLFKPFVQGDMSLTRHHTGTGLGLAIVKGLAEAMGGNVQLQSTLNMGTTVTVRIPLQIVDDTPKAITSPDSDVVDSHAARRVALETVATSHSQPWAEKKVSQAALTTSTGLATVAQNALMGVRALIVEDETTSGAVMVQMLDAVGATSTLALNASSAFSMLASQAFDVVLMDLQMPGMSGTEATRAIRTSADPSVRHIPVIGVSGNLTRGEPGLAIASGMTDFLSKPVNLDTLVATILQALHRT